MRVMLLGATGTIGRAVAEALAGHGYEVTCFLRPRSQAPELPGTELRFGDVTDIASIRRAAFAGQAYDAVVSCLASRTGRAQDAWAIDHAAHSSVLKAAREAGVARFVLLSAICVQKPLLPFQQAKLAFEAELRSAGLTWSIVRPTAFFKSLSGQIQRVRDGKPYLLFGNGDLTACKPISDRDLAEFIVNCLTDPDRQNRILPIGGPGPALTPRAQAEILFDLLGQQPKFRRLPVAMMDAIIAGLSIAGRVSPNLAAKADLARIGRYYATESMLLLDPETGAYDADATPESGSDTLRDHFAAVLHGDVEVDLGDHAMF